MIDDSVSGKTISRRAFLKGGAASGSTISLGMILCGSIV